MSNICMLTLFVDNIDTSTQIEHSVEENTTDEPTAPGDQYLLHERSWPNSDYIGFGCFSLSVMIWTR